ncbi:phytanoyl-CoA dioxygenase family protein [Sphingomonas sp. 28-62-11]|uniref:phytanoyl-CoA dioxygenase family protein n=1 Tax=Sphingomonas sp. 28-62-11 TaxID=1970432 RepID=UPI000BC911AB|nr:MAG: phytanoyl-CoA dioxygenase [Sphingomonas sp. 28-62-11]
MTVVTDQLDFDKDGAVLHAGAALSILSALEAELADVPPDLAGARLYNRAGLSALLDVTGPIGSLTAQMLGSDAHAIRAILFDKTAATNWALGWHQDRTIAVKERVDVAGYGPWSIKAGVHHVEPPFAVIEQMVTLRIHLDPVPADNAPLLIAPGSHRFGRVPESEVPALVVRCGTHACLADRGDVWVYRTPILHASAAATSVTGRRVLQVDYSAEQLAHGLRWAGV